MTAVAERQITWADVSRATNRLMAERDGEWSGIPIPVAGLRLTVEDKNPWQERIAALQAIVDEREPAPTADAAEADIELVNEWYSRAQRCSVLVVREQGRPRAVRINYDAAVKSRALFDTLAASSVWPMDAEVAALETLRTLIKPHLFAAYVFTGTFLETSARSGLTYIFRRLRPTLALSHAAYDGGKLLCALCLHPIGYYAETWAGSMVPTDDVIAHLLLMRADEPLFWRRANQHSVHHPLAGL